MKRVRLLPMLCIPKIVCVPSLLVCLLLVAYPIPGMASTDWVLAKEESGITVHTRDVDGSPVKQFKASTNIAASLASVLAVMLDSDACSEWMYRCQNAEIVQQRKFGDSSVYRTINLPWPVADRDIVMNKRVSQDPVTETVTIKNVATPDAVPRTKLVRIEVSESLYTIEPREDGTVKLTWTQLSDPAGALPKTLVNSMIVTSPLSTLKKLREMVKKPKYKNAKLTHDDKGVLTGFAGSLIGLTCMSFVRRRRRRLPGETDN